MFKVLILTWVKADCNVTLILVPPKFTKRPVDSFAEEKEDLELSCEVEGHPEPKVTWLKNGEEIKPNDYIQVMQPCKNNILVLR
jgi:Immunoglobulin I-set domain